MADGEVVYDIRGDSSNLDSDLNQAEKKTSGFLGKTGSAFKTAGKIAGVAFSAIGSAAIAAGTKAVTGAVDLDQAMNQFAAATGVGEAALEAYEDTLKSIYANNYGESFEDIAGAMASVRQQMGELDQTSLQHVTEGVYALSDVFGSDFNETLRGVNQLTTQFGISAENALDLLATGSQQGLDYTDELGDNISEYAGKFAQAGYTAEEYFQLLKNGTENGSYNLDKVNDSINEITNRIADGTIGKAIEQFSAGTQKVFAEWQKGGATQKDVIDAIVKDINSCKNEQQALTMAATAFGTMGEDANLDFIKSLSSVGDAFDKTKGKMEEMKKVKYDDLGSMLQGLLRSLEALLLPLGEKLIPIIQSLVDTLMPHLEEYLEPIMETLGGVVQQILPLVETLLPPMLEIISMLMPYLTEIIDKVLPVLMEILQTLLPPLMEIVEALLPPLFAVLDAILDPLLELVQALLPPLSQILEALAPLLQALTPIIEFLAELFSDVLGAAINAVMPIITELMNILKGVIDFITGVFSGDWEKAWNGIVAIFKGIFNLIPAIVEGVINGAIGIINGIIKGINGLTGLIGIPEIPLIPDVTLPRFHTGGIVDFEAGEGLALLKDGEMVLTQAQQKQLFELASGGSGLGGQPIVVQSPVYLDGRLISKNTTGHQFSDVMARRYR